VMLNKPGTLPEAEKEFRETIRLAPDLAPALAGLGDVLDKLGRRKEARAWWKKAKPLAKDPALVKDIEKRLKGRD